MRKGRFIDERIVGTLRESEAGLKTADLCRKRGISTNTLHRWLAKYGGMQDTELRKLKPLQNENPESPYCWMRLWKLSVPDTTASDPVAASV